MLTFQLQVLAASTLSCRHAADVATSEASQDGIKRVPAHCPHANRSLASAETIEVSLGSGGAGPAFGDCQKCMLDLCAFGALDLLAQSPMMIEPLQSLPSPGQQPHFYRYSVDLWSKPPIFLLS
ncbi:hypothetical protein [Halochromatium sp.]